MKKILLVEDNEINMKLFYDILSFQGHDVEKSFDGEDAYDKILKGGYDLMILDIALPKMDGFTLLKKLKGEGANIPKTLIVSAFAMDKDKQQAKMLGCDNSITKPIDVTNFIAQTNKLLGIE